MIVDSKRETNIGDTIVSFGKYRTDNKTVAEIWATDEKWASTVVAMDLDKCGEVTRRQINALKRYKEGV